MNTFTETINKTGTRNFDKKHIDIYKICLMYYLISTLSIYLEWL